MDIEVKNPVDIMPKKENTINTSIRVPEDKYTVLEEIKILKNKPINALVVEGIDLIIKEYKEDLRSNRDRRAGVVDKVLNELEK